VRYKLRWAAVLLVIAFITQAGCWDRREIEDQAYVIMLGIDKAPDQGLFITALVAEVTKVSAGAMQSSVTPSTTSLAAKVLTARAATITQAVHILNGGMTRDLALRHLRGVVVGESLAREGLESVLMELHRHPRARTNALLAQARGRAHEVLASFHPVAEVNPARMAEGYLLQAKSLHLAPPIRLHSFLSRLAAVGEDPYLPVAAVNPAVDDLLSPLSQEAQQSSLAGNMPRAGGNPVELVGTAVFRRDRLVGFLNVDQTQMLLAMKGAMGKAYMSFPDPDKKGESVTMRFHQENFPEVKAEFQGGAPSVHMAFKFEGELLVAPGGTDYSQPAARDRLERAAEAFADKTMQEVVDQVLKWQVDPVGLGQRYRGRFSSWAAWEAYEWHSKLAELRLTVETTMRVRRYGLYTGPDQVQAVR
jgi:spore germination protein KC